MKDFIENKNGKHKNFIKILIVIIAVAFVAFIITDAITSHQFDKKSFAKDVVGVPFDTIYGKTIVYLYVIDSCEYLGSINTRHSDFCMHKGNCKYCDARQKKMIKELLNSYKND